jgi:hypothetical protein
MYASVKCFSTLLNAALLPIGGATIRETFYTTEL